MVVDGEREQSGRARRTSRVHIPPPGLDLGSRHRGIGHASSRLRVLFPRASLAAASGALSLPQPARACHWPLPASSPSRLPVSAGLSPRASLFSAPLPAPLRLPRPHAARPSSPARPPGSSRTSSIAPLSSPTTRPLSHTPPPSFPLSQASAPIRARPPLHPGPSPRPASRPSHNKPTRHCSATPRAPQNLPWPKKTSPGCASLISAHTATSGRSLTTSFRPGALSLGRGLQVLRCPSQRCQLRQRNALSPSPYRPRDSGC